MFHLLYDGDCTFCAGFARRVEARGAGAVALVPFAQRERIRALAPGLDDDKLHASFHLVRPDGAVLSGPEALPELARQTLPAGRAVGWAIGLFPGVLRWTYKWVSEHRW